MIEIQRLFFLLILVFTHKLFAHGEGWPLKENQLLPPILERLVFEVEFRRTIEGEFLKSNESGEGRTYGNLLPLAHPSEMNKIRNYFNSFYFPRGYYILRIDTKKMDRQNIFWRQHMNLPVHGEFFSAIPSAAILDLSVWIHKEGVGVVKIADKIPYEWVEQEDYIQSPEKLFKKQCMRAYTSQ